jgi:hypothetical protein
MAKRLTQLDKAIQNIDQKIAGLQTAREELYLQKQQQERATPPVRRRRKAASTTGGGDGTNG